MHRVAVDHHPDGESSSDSSTEHEHNQHHHAPHAAPLRDDLERGAGVGQVLFLDAFSGVAGDMFAAALIDLGVPLAPIETALAGLPLDGYTIEVESTVRSGIVARRFLVHIETPQPERTYTEIRTMLESDAQNPHTTRPYIAKGAFLVIAFCCIAVVSAWCVGVIKSDAETIKAAQEGSTFVLFTIGPLVTVLLAYFGVLKAEHKNRLDAANGGSSPSGIAGILSAVLKR